MHRLATTYLALASARGVAAQQLEAVGSFDVPAYLGRWFQTHGSATVKYTFELGGNCVTAEYAETGRPGVVAVTNTVRLPKAFGVVPIPSIKIKGAGEILPLDPPVILHAFSQPPPPPTHTHIIYTPHPTPALPQHPP